MILLRGRITNFTRMCFHHLTTYELVTYNSIDIVNYESFMTNTGKYVM